MELEIFNEKVYELVDPAAPLEKLAEGFNFTEGPVFCKGVYYFTDFRENKIFRYKNGEVSLVTDESNFAVGMTYDRHKDRIVRCTRNLRAITDLEGNIIVNNYRGTPINGSNDVIVDSKGRIYFTDPLSRVIEGPQIGHSSVFMYDEDRDELTMLEKTLTYPNGLALSPDETILYIADTNAIALYKIDPAGKGGLELFCQMDEAKGKGRPDGLRVDVKGNIYCTGPGGIWLIDPKGVPLGLLRTPEVAANLCFDEGGLFITASTGIYRVNTKIPSAVL